MFKPPVRNEQTGNDTVIASGVKVEGDFTSAGNIIIEGEVTGTLKTEMDLSVGPDAKITANVTARNARISGEMNGNITVTERAELSATARVTGDLQAKVMVVEAGAVLNGRCGVGPQAAASFATEAARPESAPVLRGRAVKAES